MKPNEQDNYAFIAYQEGHRYTNALNDEIRHSDTWFAK